LKKLFILIAFIAFVVSTYAQSKHDSLWVIWADETCDDTIRLQALNQFTRSGYLEKQQDSAIHYAQIQSKYASKKRLKKYNADALYNLGWAYKNKGGFSSAVEYYQMSYQLYDEIGDIEKMALVLYRIGEVNIAEGDYEKAIAAYQSRKDIAENMSDKKMVASSLRRIARSYYLKGQFTTSMKHIEQSLKISEEIKDDYGIAWCLNSFGISYIKQGSNEKALEYLFKALEISERIGDSTSITISLLSIGEIHTKLGNKDQSMVSLERALEISKQLNNNIHVAYALSNIGNNYSEHEDKKRALEYFQRSLSLAKQIRNKDIICENLIDIGKIQLHKGNYKQSITECQKSYKIAVEIGSEDNQMYACDCLYESYKTMGEYDKALFYHEKMLVLEDSINYESLSNNLREMEFTKQLFTDSLRQSEEKLVLAKAQQEEMRDKDRTKNIFVFSGLFLLFIAGGLWSRMRFIRKGNTRLQIEKDRAETSENLMHQFLANISHEFRTPLTIISGLSNELLEDNENDTQRNLLKGITYSNNQLLNLVNQTLDLSSLDAKKMIPSYKNGDIIIFIEKCVSIFKSYTDSKQLTLTFKSDISNLTMDFDDDKLQKILNNLLSNAIKFTPEKGEIDVYLKQIKNQLRIIVSDTGIGIEKKELSQIFERYYKTYDLKQNIGTGIGLALTKELVKLLQGSISIDSKIGIGTTFIVDLPIQNTSIKADTFHKIPFIDYDDNHVSQIKKGIKQKTTNTILLVEDNKEIINFIKLILCDLYTIYTANNGVKGLKIANNKHIDFIISDVMMPEMDGFEFCKHIKKDINTSHIPFVIISARTETKDKVEAYKLGVDAYLIKPFNKQELLLIIKNLLGKKQKQISFLSNLLYLRNNHKEVPDINELDLNLIKNIQEFALDNNKQMSIEELAQHLYTSRSQLHKKVKSLTGMSITNYMNHIRIEKAKDLLKTTQLTISEIAYDVGFVSSNYFSRSFKKTTNTSPVSYRQRHS